jgi:hypothetical protein
VSALIDAMAMQLRDDMLAGELLEETRNDG